MSDLDSKKPGNQGSPATNVEGDAQGTPAILEEEQKQSIVDPEQQKRERDRYEKYYDHLVRFLQSNGEAYDRAILSVTTLMLGGSLTFVNQAVPLKTADHKCWLLAACIGCIVSILANLLSFHVGGFWLNKQAKMPEAQFWGKEAQKNAEKSHCQIETLRFFSSLGFFTGIVCIVVFMFLNLGD